MKKLTTFLVAVAVCLLGALPAWAALPVNAPEKLAAVEKYLYGTEQTGSLVARIDSLEMDMDGATSSDSVLNRINSLYKEMNGGASGLTFATKLNAIESQFSERMGVGPAKTRIDNLERVITGTTHPDEALTTRLNNLTNVAYPNQSLKAAATVVPKDALVKVKFLEEIASKTAQVGDEIDFVVAENYYEGNTLVLPKGAKGFGTVAKVVQPRIFGRDARIDMNFSNVLAVDGTQVPVYVGDLAKQGAKTAAGAAGASIGGMVIFGPVGVVGGAFVKGQSVTIPNGSYTYVQVQEDTMVNGIVQDDVAVTGSQLSATTTNEEK